MQGHQLGVSQNRLGAHYSTAYSARDATIVGPVADQLRALVPEFAFTSLYVSRGCRAKLHVDDSNVGASYQISRGPHFGGQLLEVRSVTDDVDVFWEKRVSNRTNGSRPHVGLPYTLLTPTRPA